MTDNEKYNRIINEVYANYLKWADKHSKTHLYEPYTQEQFINKCKHSIEYSVRWGLKIEEQTVFEQVDQNNPVLKGSTALGLRKLIIVTNNNETLEVYE